MEIESLQYEKSSLPPVESLIGSFVSLISRYGLRYDGVLYYINFHESTLRLHNVICYGTEGTNNTRFQIPPSTDVYSFIVFTVSEIKNVLFMPPTRFGSPRGSISSKFSYSPSRKRHRVPLLTNEKHKEPEDTTESDASSVDDRLQITSDSLVQSQFLGSNYYDPWCNIVYQSIPYGTIYQAPINAENWHESYAPDTHSFFTTFPPVPIALPPKSGGFNLKALNQNFAQYQLWPPSENNNQREQTDYTNYGSRVNTIEGSFYKISRNPFDPTETPCK